MIFVDIEVRRLTGGLGLFIRRPNQDETFANWKTSAAGLREDDEGWVYVPPVPGVHTVILGECSLPLRPPPLPAIPEVVPDSR